jgi:hypothetical protein
LRKTFIAILACIIVSSTTATSQTRRRSSTKPSARASKVAADKSLAEIKAGSQRVAAQIKSLTHFLYLLGGIAKGIESVDQAVRSSEASTGAIELNKRNKTSIRESLRGVREGLDKLESEFRFNPALTKYYPTLAGVAKISEAAENQAAANRFDEAGRSLLKAVSQLADALAAMR